MRRRNRRNSEGGNSSHERWLITYADLITLLMIFFVVMYAMSQVDASKYASLSQTLQSSFGDSAALPAGAGILEGAYTKPGDTGALKTAKDGGSGDMKDDKPVAIGAITEKDLAFRKQEAQLRNFMNVIQQYVNENKLGDQIEVADTPKGIAIRMSDKLLFDLGRADLKANAIPTMDKLASLFPQLDTTVSIEGHTDNLKMSAGGRYKDNWELSAERALSVLRFFVDDKHMDASKFQIAGYGDTRPITDNDSAENRQKNRRVEIIVLRNMIQ
ncbi:flagellar motor protein MotB [Paenibacillus sp. 481]|uniref:flagellar motor protein MotB n=1 Tax=Paenibacillus sp. 481 TaxID=2835869 RepID=UPI001E2A168E|nr:flagellar motor protein MotB [Paenibacillus sp. 481]UHA71638.1 OmpA family protein [Paenibacillus sp. 481]